MEVNLFMCMKQESTIYNLHNERKIVKLRKKEKRWAKQRKII